MRVVYAMLCCMKVSVLLLHLSHFFFVSRQSASWISKLEARYVTFLVLLTSIRMNKDGKLLCLRKMQNLQLRMKI